MSLSSRNVNISEGKGIISGKDELEGQRTSEKSEDEADGETASQDGPDQSSLVSDSEEVDKDPITARFCSKAEPCHRGGAVGLCRRSQRGHSKETSSSRTKEGRVSRSSGRKYSTGAPREGKEEEHVNVDDTDGLHPLGDFDAWRFRELVRIKRDRGAEIAREQQREVDQRRALPEEQRMKEDLAHAQRSRDEKPKGGQRFLQNFWHKECLPSDRETLKRHDLTEATESAVDVSPSNRHASKEFREALEDEVHSSARPRHHSLKWRI
ncbi:splicing factor, Prp19-binding domain-containing protein [Lactarius indigo]|nr:splicing factor, Prp19-binding domain-containing protein [Lactarius indigo]